MNSSDLLAPSSMGIEDPVINNLIEQLTEANSERNTFIANNQQLSPAFATVTSTISNLKTSISETIRYSISNTQVSFTISNCNLTGASVFPGAGIYLENVMSSELVENIVDGNDFGIYLDH